MLGEQVLYFIRLRWPLGIFCLLLLVTLLAVGSLITTQKCVLMSRPREQWTVSFVDEQGNAVRNVTIQKTWPKGIAIFENFQKSSCISASDGTCVLRIKGLKKRGGRKEYRLFWVIPIRTGDGKLKVYMTASAPGYQTVSFTSADVFSSGNHISIVLPWEDDGF